MDRNNSSGNATHRLVRASPCTTSPRLRSYTGAMAFRRWKRNANRLGTSHTPDKAVRRPADLRPDCGVGHTISSLNRTNVVESRTPPRALPPYGRAANATPLHLFMSGVSCCSRKSLMSARPPNGERREFQVGTNETVASVANRHPCLFARGCRTDPSIFPARHTYPVAGHEDRGGCPHSRGSCFPHAQTLTASVRRSIQFFFVDLSWGARQYFTMRQLSRFTVAMLGRRTERLRHRPHRRGVAASSLRSLPAMLAPD